MTQPETINEKDSRPEDSEHRHPITYTVDGEPQTTTEHELTARQILQKAGIDPDAHYLVQILPNGDRVSFQEEPNKEIKLHNHDKFVSVLTGPTPVSKR